MNKYKSRFWDENLKKMIYFGFNNSNIMQSTGLQDKNGKDVYEGDIINLKDKFKIIRTGIAMFDLDGFYIKFQDKSFKYYCHVRDTDEFEVIGNIYENPEL